MERFKSIFDMLVNLKRVDLRWIKNGGYVRTLFDSTAAELRLSAPLLRTEEAIARWGPGLGNRLRREGSYGLPIITSVALMRASAWSPGLRASSRAASEVMMAVMRCLPMAMTIFASNPSMVTSSTVPAS